MSEVHPCPVIVLRLGHRVPRDKRITTHVCLVARAFGAQGVYVAGDRDSSVMETVTKLTDKWGGPFWVDFIASPEKLIDNYKQKGWVIVHLTMYGLPVHEVLPSIKQVKTGILVIVGAEKVPPWAFEKADYNVAIGSQPHSEVAALAIFLDRLSEGRWINLVFKDAKIRVVPSPRGKRVERLEH